MIESISSLAFAVSITIMTAILLFVAAWSVKRSWVAATLPIALIVVASSVFTIQDIMGRPAERDPIGKFVFLSYHTDGKFLYMWIIEDPSRGPVTLKSPYEQEEHKKMEGAKKKKAKGVAVVGTKAKVKKKDGEWTPGKLLFYDFIPSHDAPPKDPNN